MTPGTIYRSFISPLLILKLQFNLLTDIIYNVYPSGSGEIIAGRVTDTNGNPVSGATVTATRSAGGVYTATTNAKGIYAIVKVPSSSSYNVIATKPGLSFAFQSVSTGASATGTINTGNVWGVDFVAGAIPHNPLNHALDNNALGFTTSGSANWFEESTNYYYGGSAAQNGAIVSRPNQQPANHRVRPRDPVFLLVRLFLSACFRLLINSFSTSMA